MDFRFKRFKTRKIHLVFSRITHSYIFISTLIKKKILTRVSYSLLDKITLIL